MENEKSILMDESETSHTNGNFVFIFRFQMFTSQLIFYVSTRKWHNRRCSFGGLYSWKENPFVDEWKSRLFAIEAEKLDVRMEDYMLFHSKSKENISYSWEVKAYVQVWPYIQ